MTLYDILTHLNSISSIEKRSEELKDYVKYYPGLLEFLKLIYLKEGKYTFTSILQYGKIILRPVAYNDPLATGLQFNQVLCEELPLYSDQSTAITRPTIRRAKLIQVLDELPLEDASLILIAIDNSDFPFEIKVSKLLVSMTFPEIFN